MTDVQRIVDKVLKPQLGKLGLERVVVTEGIDHEGETSLFIDAEMKPGARIVGGEISSRVYRALSEALLEAGETRLPYFNIRHPDENVPAPFRRSSRQVP